MNRPIVETIEVHAEPPSLRDNTGDADRLVREVARVCRDLPVLIPFEDLTTVSRRFRQANFCGRAVVCEAVGRHEIVDFLPAGPRPPLPGLALDLGTTHLEACLVDLATGATLAQETELNGQTRLGDDVLTRIHHAAKPGGLAELQAAVRDSIAALARRLSTRAGIAPEGVRAMSVAGNPAMTHLLLGLDPYHLCREPYIPLVNAPAPLLAASLGLPLHPRAQLVVLPGTGSYFGGDLVAGVLACGMDEASQVSMLIDVGTNAEVVLGNQDWLIACAGAAGPALEGGVARMGMRAGPGAIERVDLALGGRRVEVRTIGGEAPRGLCGSGLIDLASQLFEVGLVDARGRFRPERAPDAFGWDGEARAFVVVPADRSATGAPILFSQVDLEALLRSKAAMYAILTTIVNQVGVGFADLAAIHVAGAFGEHIDPRRAVVLGMLPDLPLSVYRPVGNSSLSGAKAILLDRGARERCRRAASRITYVELNVNQEFMMRFSGAKFIPHTDRRLFPSVPDSDGGAAR